MNCVQLLFFKLGNIKGFLTPGEKNGVIVLIEWVCWKKSSSIAPSQMTTTYRRCHSDNFVVASVYRVTEPPLMVTSDMRCICGNIQAPSSMSLVMSLSVISSLPCPMLLTLPTQFESLVPHYVHQHSSSVLVHLTNTILIHSIFESTYYTLHLKNSISSSCTLSTNVCLRTFIKARAFLFYII